MDHRTLTLTQHAAIVALTRNVQTPKARRVLVNLNIVRHGMLDQRNRNNRVLFRRREIAQNAHMVRRTILAVTLHHVRHKIVADARAINAAHMHRVPIITQTIVRVIKEPSVPRRVTRQHRRRTMSRHRSRGRLEDRRRNTAGFVGNQQNVLAVDTRQRLRLLSARRPARNKRALRLTLQLNAIRLQLQQIVKRRLQPLGDVLHLSKAGVEKLG